MKNVMTGLLALTLLSGSALAQDSSRFVVLNSGTAFLDIPAFNAEGVHNGGSNCGGTFGSDRTCSITVPSDTTKLVIHMGFGNGIVDKTVVSEKGFDGRLVYCDNRTCTLIRN